MGPSFHPVIAVDANEETVLGFVDNFLLARQGGERDTRKQRDFVAKDSGRWLSGAESASAFSEAGAACVTVFEDRESDVYECCAFKPANVEKLVRAAQDRRLADGTSLFSKASAWGAAGTMAVELPAAPGRAARRAELSVKFGTFEILRPKHRTAASGLPKTIKVTLVIGREVNPAEGEDPALWLLLTTHRVNDIADARRIIGFYRLRWTNEQLFRTRRRKASMWKRCVRKQMDRSKSSSLRSCAPRSR